MYRRSASQSEVFRRRALRRDLQDIRKLADTLKLVGQKRNWRVRDRRRITTVV